MQRTKRNLRRLRYLVEKVFDDNLFLLSSSVSYYSALGIAPFLLIVLSGASLVGADTQTQIVTFATRSFSPQVGEMFLLIFENAKAGVDTGSLSGIIGSVILLFTASLVFSQLRYSFDVIYGYFNPDEYKPLREYIFDKLFAMIVVVGGAALLIISFFLASIVRYIFDPGADKVELTQIFVLIVNYLFYLLMFTGIHYFTPSRRPNLRLAFKISSLSSLFFIVGNVLLAKYLREVAASSVYGAAGTLLIFLVWAFYSSFTIFLSVEVFLYLRKIGKIRQKIT